MVLLKDSFSEISSDKVDSGRRRVNACSSSSAISEKVGLSALFSAQHFVIISVNEINTEEKRREDRERKKRRIILAKKRGTEAGISSRLPFPTKAVTSENEG